KQYGWIFAFIAMGLITASQVNTLLLRKYSSDQIIKATLFCQCLAGIALVLGTWFHLLGLFSTEILILTTPRKLRFSLANSYASSLAAGNNNLQTATGIKDAIH